MSLLLCAAYLAYHSSLAASTPLSFDAPPPELLPGNSSAVIVPPQFDQRSITDILGGCLATIFACSWVAVHPNIPPPDAKWWHIALTRFELMVWTIIAPEAIILWAARQWIAARQLKKDYQERGWTITHGFFIQMGGFMLFDGKVRKGVLSPSRFEILLRRREIAFPEITVEEIEDRSKGDGLSKALVLVQTTWFIAQLGARVAEGLAITPLELATSGFAALNGFMYFFWWNKPLNVQLPVPVHLLSPTASINTDMTSLVVSGSSKEPAPEIYMKRPDQRPLVTVAIPRTQTIPTTINRRKWNLWPSDSLFRYRAVKSRFFIVLENPDYRLFDMMSVPMLFSSNVPRKGQVEGYIIATVLGMLFDAIHCAGWNLSFPSVREEQTWRIASFIIVGYPAIFFVPLLPQLLFRRFRVPPNEVPLKALRRVITEVFLYTVFLPTYILARLFILVEAFLALRHLPVSATYAVRWTTFLPHV